MTQLAATPFTALTLEQVDADSPGDEVLTSVIGVNLNYLKAQVDTLQADVTTLQSIPGTRVLAWAAM